MVVIYWPYVRVYIDYIFANQMRVTNERWFKDKRIIVEKYTNRLTHFIHFFNDIPRVYLDNDNGLEL